MSEANGLSPQGFWTTKDVRIITEKWGHLDYKEIAGELKRTPKALLLKAQDLGLTSARQRTRHQATAHQRSHRLRNLREIELLQA